MQLGYVDFPRFHNQEQVAIIELSMKYLQDTNCCKSCTGIYGKYVNKRLALCVASPPASAALSPISTGSLLPRVCKPSPQLSFQGSSKRKQPQPRLLDWSFGAVAVMEAVSCDTYIHPVRKTLLHQFHRNSYP